MDEISAIQKAREFINAVRPQTIPVPVNEFVDHIGAIVRMENDLEPDEPGWSFKNKGKHYICVNSKDKYERQRFTICHELAHILLGLPSDHSIGPSWSYARKSSNEIFCDVFASELLLPHNLFRPLIDKVAVCLDAIDCLAERFEASTMATGSRFVTLSSTPCAFVLAERGKVRYTSRSTALRVVNAWVPPRMALPKGTMSERLRLGSIAKGPEEVEADLWFTDWARGGILLEEARHLGRWDQTMTLLWFEDEEVPPPVRDRQEWEEQEFGLAELDGILPWPGKRRRR